MHPIVCFIILLAASVAPVYAQKRVALVIGNGGYQHEGKLDNPGNDARAVASALKRIQFDDVQIMLDGNLKSMNAALASFARVAAAADMAVVYYSGHGIEVDGQNYLLPVDARLDDAADVDFEAVSLDLVLRAADRAGKVKMVVLDACRNNPFAARMLQRESRRAVGRGLAAPTTTSAGMLVAYAARAGTTASDGPRGGNSPFTSAFLKYVDQPRVEIRRFFGMVRDEVVRATRRQEPFTYGSLGGDEIFLNVAPRSAAAPSTSTPSLDDTYPKMLVPISEAERAWSRIASTNDQATLEAFARRFPDTFYADVAQVRLNNLRKEQQRIEQAALQQADQARRRAGAEGAAGKAADDDARAKAGEQPRKHEDTGKSAGGKKSFRDCADCPEMVLVPAGSFLMGSPESEPGREDDEGPQHRVTIVKPIAVAKYETTFAEWEKCVDAGACKHAPGDMGWGRGSRPVINVSWTDAKQYTGWLSRLTNKSYRLLTESEWEYAARGVTSTSARHARYHFGDDERSLCQYANIADQTGKDKYKDWAAVACRDGHVNTAPVGTFRPNAFGLFDMIGNVWEWVEDCDDGDYKRVPVDGRPAAVAEGCPRIIRGGSWGARAQKARVAYRSGYQPDYRDQGVGFRVARSN